MHRALRWTRLVLATLSLQLILNLSLATQVDILQRLDDDHTTLDGLSSIGISHDEGSGETPGVGYSVHPDSTLETLEDQEEYTPDFVGIDRSVVGRAPNFAANLKVLANNAPVPWNIMPGNAYTYIFLGANATGSAIGRRETPERNGTGPESTAWRSEERRLDLRQTTIGNITNATRTVYVTINTCLQPNFKNTDDIESPPQLTLHLNSTEPALNISQPLVEGYANITLNTTANIYISVSAPNVSINGIDAWNYELAASIDQPYHFYNNSDPQLYMIDSDRNASLLVSKGLLGATPPTMNSSEWLSHGPPLTLFVQNTDNPSVNGMTHSYCGLKQKAQLVGIPSAPEAGSITTGITLSQGEHGNPEQQFYVPNLNGTSLYYGFLARTGNTTSLGNGTPGGGGAIYSVMNFTTKQFANCAVIYNLSFCSDIAYSVPANPATFPSLTGLAAHYDNYTATMYQYFNYSLQQVPCNTTDSAQYSLVKTCDDCAAAYKTWLCAVTIPRCQDWIPNPPVPAAPSNDDTNPAARFPGVSDPNVYLMPRNAAQTPIAATPDIHAVTNLTLLDWLATNSSRNNDTIAGAIQPGPYMEVLPCADLCYELVRACPASLQFGCPVPGKGLEVAYGRRGVGHGGQVRCSAPGVLWGYSAGDTLLPKVWRVVCIVGCTVFALLLT